MNKAFLQKAAGFCAYQERTQAEVRERLAEWRIFGEDAEQMISWLIVNNYVNEERFAKAFAGGKFRIKGWGKTRIEHELKMRGLSKYCIAQGLAQIPDDDYEIALNNLIDKKTEEFDFENALIKKQKIARYLIGKGYESVMVWNRLNQK